MKEKLSLLDVCKLPDVQLHSKTAFFKSIVSRESPEVLHMKDHIASLSYTVKVIGVQGEQVGITSKRVPMAFKRGESKPIKPNFVAVDNYLPHKTFYSHALVPIHLQKEPRLDNQPIFAISTNGAIKVDPTERKTASFKTRARSMASMRTVQRKRQPQNIGELGKIKGKQEAPGGLKKKSYSGLLKECNAVANEQMNPLLHEENPLFKKIQKIKDAYPKTDRLPVKIERYESRGRQSHSSLSSVTQHYEDQV